MSNIMHFLQMPLQFSFQKESFFTHFTFSLWFWRTIFSVPFENLLIVIGLTANVAVEVFQKLVLVHGYFGNIFHAMICDSRNELESNCSFFRKKSHTVLPTNYRQEKLLHYRSQHSKVVHPKNCPSENLCTTSYWFHHFHKFWICFLKMEAVCKKISMGKSHPVNLKISQLWPERHRRSYDSERLNRPKELQ